MSNPEPFEEITHIRDDVRRLARRAETHSLDLQGLVRAAETDVRDAEAALTHARGGTPDESVERVRTCSTRLHRSRENAEAVQHACLSARQQSVAARRLLSLLGDECGDEVAADSHAHAAAVLVVDDAEDTRNLVALVLRNAGFVVRTAVNGLEGLIAAHEMQPAIIVMDVTMPVLNGIEATRLIKAADLTRDAKVIAYTANPSLPDIMVDRLFVSVLSKPSTPQALLTAVQRVASL